VLPDPLDDALIRVADGDRAAFDDVYEALSGPVLALCRRRIGDAARADDVAQEALIKIFVHAERYDPARGSARAWALGVASWEARTHLRRAARSREAPLDGLVCDERADPEHRAAGRQLLDDVQTILGTLSPTDRTTLLAVWAGGPRPDVPAATFRKRLQRALTRFRAAWSSDDP